MVENASAVKVFVQSPLLATMSHKYCIYECYETFFMLREGCIDMLICCCFFFIHIFLFQLYRMPLSCWSCHTNGFNSRSKHKPDALDF